MESLRLEVAPFGIHDHLVNPGFFRTESSPQSTQYAEPAIDDYADRRVAYVAAWKATSGQQSGDPAKLARALVTLAGEEPPRRRFIAGADAIGTAQQKVADLQADIDLNRDRFVSLDDRERALDPPEAVAQRAPLAQWIRAADVGSACHLV